MKKRLLSLILLISISALFAEDESIYGNWKCKVIDFHVITIRLPAISPSLSELPEDSIEIPQWESNLWFRSFKSKDSIILESGSSIVESELLSFELNESGSGSLNDQLFQAVEDGNRSYTLIGGEFSSEEEGNNIERTTLDYKWEENKLIFQMTHQSIDAARGKVVLYYFEFIPAKSPKGSKN